MGEGALVHAGFVLVLTKTASQMADFLFFVEQVAVAVWEMEAGALDQDQFFIARTLELAALARGKTSPNPMVGAVVVGDGTVLGEGYHHQAGTPHAEILALRQAGLQARGATLYVSLEPCCHFGRTPPCTEAIIRAGIKRVVAATPDPNPLVAGNGLKALQQAGLAVRSGVLDAEARRLNEAFFKYILAGQPFVTLKAGISLDGKIATRTGDSKWITGPEARNLVQHLRAENDAVLVGIGTVLADDPSLTVRLPGVEKKPLRVVADSSLRIPPESRLVQTAWDCPTIVAAVEGQCPPGKKELLRSRGVEVWELPGVDSRVDIRALLRELGRRELVSLLLEGGSLLNANFLKGRAVDKFIFFVAPRIIGGSGAPGPFGGAGAATLSEAQRLTILECGQIDADLMITGYPEPEFPERMPGPAGSGREGPEDRQVNNDLEIAADK
jgi:diaminohydroxyphosphoribosylaminopyrimidine deaminase/5-amino-6-(5-phosphoribosylamino)uracil reductase